MKKLIFLLFTIFLFSCKEEVYTDYVCTCTKEQREKASTFVQNSIKNANNMSDEEMEDVIVQLERTSYRLYCSKENISYTFIDGRRQVVSELDSGKNVIF